MIRRVSVLGVLLEARVEPRDRRGRWVAEVGSAVHVASELRYIGKGKIVHREPGGSFHVELADGRRGRVAPDQVFRTKREAQDFARVPQRGGLSDVMKLNVVGKPGTKAARMAGMSESLLESFAAAPPTSGPVETPAQSQARGAQQVAAARSAVAQGWNASKHPRARGGKFGYTTGGKRATRSSSAHSHVVSQGAKGALVRSIQRQLGLPQDGVYGPNTHAAVVRFQRQHGLQVDGIVGAQTLAALRGNAHASAIRPGPISSRATRLKASRASQPKAARAKATQPKVNRYQGGVLI